jgi:hypothetical protein
MGWTLVLLATAALAAEDAAWLRTDGAGELPWGTQSMPFDAVPRARSSYLPDTGFVGRNPSDRPEDLEMTGAAPGGERRFLRYVDGALVDAAVLRPAPLDPSPLVGGAAPAWSGPVLGAGDGPFRLIGEARGWVVDGRTVTHWVAREGGLELLSSRAQPGGRYKALPPEVLRPGAPGKAALKVKGPLAPLLKPVEAVLSGCLDASPLPVEATIEVGFDAAGRPAKVRAENLRGEGGVFECVAGALVAVAGPPRAVQAATLVRTR